MKDTIALLKECNAGCKSATNSMEQVRSYVKDERLKHLITHYNDRHIALGDECHVMLEELGQSEKDPSPIPAAMAKLSSTIKLTVNSDTSHVAELLADGCNMGVKSLAKYHNKYEQASPEAKRLASDLIKLELDMTRDLLAFI